MELIHEPSVAGYDDMTVMRLPRVIKRLDEGELATALKYEAAHADRPIVKRMLTLRMMQLAAENNRTPEHLHPVPAEERALQKHAGGGEVLPVPRGDL